jgi:geranylgeranyl transferase type-2 subunit beta
LITDHRLGSPWKLGNDDDEKSDTKSTDSIKLKGVQWPGMDLFDSATPEMKRMRNQRKDSSVLEQMKATSAEITTEEVVYNLDGSVSHIRDIFGPPSCDVSPVSIPILRVLLLPTGKLDLLTDRI